MKEEIGLYFYYDLMLKYNACVDLLKEKISCLKTSYVLCYFRQKLNDIKPHQHFSIIFCKYLPLLTNYV